MQIGFCTLFSPYKLSNFLTQEPSLRMCKPDKHHILLKAICRNTFKCNYLGPVGSFKASSVDWVLMLNIISINPHSLVPQEIQAQGHRAEAAFKEAIEKGSVEVYRGRIMLIGQDRAGKTSLKKFLLGIPFNPEEESTVGIKVDPTKLEVEVDQVKNWELTEHKKLDLSEYGEDIAKITATHMKALEGESQETTDSVDLEQELSDPSRLQVHNVIVLSKIDVFYLRQ